MDNLVVSWEIILIRLFQNASNFVSQLVEAEQPVIH